MSERKLIEVEDGVFVYDPLDYLNIDFNDWSFTVKNKFDKIDNDRMERLKYQGIMGSVKAKTERSQYGSRHLGRWGFSG